MMFDTGSVDRLGDLAPLVCRPPSGSWSTTTSPTGDSVRTI